MSNPLEAELMTNQGNSGQDQLDALGTPPAMLVPGAPTEEGPVVLPDPEQVQKATREAAPQETVSFPATQRAVEATLPPTHPAHQEQAVQTQAPREPGKPAEKQRYAGKYKSVEELEKGHIELTNMTKANYEELQRTRAAAELGEQARPLVELIGGDPELQSIIKEHVAKRNQPPEIELSVEKNALGEIERISLPPEEAAKLMQRTSVAQQPPPSEGEAIDPNDEIQRFRMEHPEATEEEVRQFYADIRDNPELIMERLWATRDSVKTAEEIATESRMATAEQMERVANTPASLSSISGAKRSAKPLSQEQQEVLEIVQVDTPTAENSELSRKLGFGL